MSKSTFPAYRLEMVGTTAWAWNVKDHGKPNAANLAKVVERFAASTQPGGCNEHLGVQPLRNARLIRQRTDEVVATYRAPSFQVI